MRRAGESGVGDGRGVWSGKWEAGCVETALPTFQSRLKGSGHSKRADLSRECAEIPRDSVYGASVARERGVLGLNGLTTRERARSRLREQQRDCKSNLFARCERGDGADRPAHPGVVRGFGRAEESKCSSVAFGWEKSCACAPAGIHGVQKILLRGWNEIEDQRPVDSACRQGGRKNESPRGCASRYLENLQSHKSGACGETRAESVDGEALVIRNKQLLVREERRVVILCLGVVAPVQSGSATAYVGIEERRQINVTQGVAGGRFLGMHQPKIRVIADVPYVESEEDRVVLRGRQMGRCSDRQAEVLAQPVNLPEAGCVQSGKRNMTRIRPCLGTPPGAVTAYHVDAVSWRVVSSLIERHGDRIFARPRTFRAQSADQQLPMVDVGIQGAASRIRPRQPEAREIARCSTDLRVVIRRTGNESVTRPIKRVASLAWPAAFVDAASRWPRNHDHSLIGADIRLESHREIVERRSGAECVPAARHTRKRRIPFHGERQRVVHRHDGRCRISSEADGTYRNVYRPGGTTGSVPATARHHYEERRKKGGEPSHE